jgi:AraC-like DNA-binding protein
VARPDTNQARLVRVPQTRGIELFQARFISYSFDRHTHDTFAIGIIDEGAATLWCRGSTVAVPRGSVLLVPPGEVHTGGRHRDAALVGYRLVYASADWLAIAASDPRVATAPPIPRNLVVRHPVLCAELARLCVALLNPSSSKLEREEHIVTVLGRLVGCRDTEHPTRAAPVAATRARDYLHAHAAEGVSLLTLAALVDQSPSQLIRVFRRTFGFTPHAYQTQRRVDIARHLLAQGSAPGAVAAQAGFVDQSHLNLHFKRRVGVTPAAYRRAHFFQDEEPARPNR